LSPDPFGVLGLPARPGLTDDDVRAAWRRVAAATHPDRADGGDAGRFAEAAAAYTELRTRYGRGEAYADLADGSRRHSRPGPTGTRAARAPSPAAPATSAAPAPASRPARHPVPPARAGSRGRPDGGAPARGRAHPARALLTRIGRGRPALFGLRLAIMAAVIAVGFLVTGTQPAAAGLATGAVTWFLLTARHDLAPARPHDPAERHTAGR
jgi:curved DNA-binding protein CbpA